MNTKARKTENFMRSLELPIVMKFYSVDIIVPEIDLMRNAVNPFWH